MARRPDGEARFTLSPRARLFGGWLAAALLIGGIAIGVAILGGNGDGTTVVASPPSGSVAPSLATVAFGTALDPATGQVAADARTERFAEGDTFVYSVPPSGTVPPEVYVEVRLVGAAEPVQPPVDAQRLPDPEVIAFSVPAARLLAEFGPGDYLMLIYADAAGDPIAEGAFELVGPPASPAASP
jgi:hypothetical protein